MLLGRPHPAQNSLGQLRRGVFPQSHGFALFLHREKRIEFNRLRNTGMGKGVKTAESGSGEEKAENSGPDKKFPPPERFGGKNWIDFLKKFHNVNIFCVRPYSV